MSSSRGQHNHREIQIVVSLLHFFDLCQEPKTFDANLRTETISLKFHISSTRSVILKIYYFNRKERNEITHIPGHVCHRSQHMVPQLPIVLVLTEIIFLRRPKLAKALASYSQLVKMQKLIRSFIITKLF